MEMTSEGAKTPRIPWTSQNSHTHTLFQLRMPARTLAAPKSIPASLPFTHVHTHTN